MSKFFKCLLTAVLMVQVGKSYATWDFFNAQLYIPFFDYLWKFDKDCQVGCHYFSFRCFFPASVYSVCRDLQFMHQCCEQFTSTTTSTTTTSTTTPSTTTSTEDPFVKPCTPTSLDADICQPEPGCLLSPYYPFWNKWLHQPGCEHKCWEHCSNPCACKTAANGNCEYHPSTGMCIARKECGQMSFKESECRRANSFYSIGGLLCHNEETIQANCENGTTIFGVNINGQSHTDKRGIYYMADNKAIYADDYNTRLEDAQNIDAIDDVDEKIYGSYAYGEANGVDKEQCLEYSINVEEDGEYELALRTLEPQYEGVGERIFSLTINKVPIALHVDLRALSNKVLTPVDIVANFRIETKCDSEETKRVVAVKGHRPIAYWGVVQVGLCISDCRLCKEFSHIDPGYVGSGLSLVRF